MNGTGTAEFDLFAVTAPGLEAVCAAELTALGLAARPEDGGVSWTGDLASLYRANLGLRSASRVLARVGTFRARTFPELMRHAARLPWPRYVRSGAAVALRVTSRKSKLYHQGAVAERIAAVLNETVGAAATVASHEDADEPQDTALPPQLIVVRVVRDVCTISADSSGVLLHQRGYRQAIAQAPLRETIAAAMLLAAGWRGDTPLIDPMCGSGTIAIEGALIARSIAPGLATAGHEPRRFAFEEWPCFDAILWRDIVAESRAQMRAHSPVPIMAADHHAAALSAARANAARAGVAADIEFRHSPVSALAPPHGTGHLVTNPPYGVRVGRRQELDALYAALGRMAREQLAGWQCALLTADDRLAAATALPLEERLATRNGGIRVRLLAATVPARTPGPAWGTEAVPKNLEEPES